MALIITAPKEVYSIENTKNTKLFLAGGVTNCPDWQTAVCKELRGVDGLTIYNPRRKTFKDTPQEAEKQIVWEYNHLADADILAFWFSHGSLNPITLYELGRWGNSAKKQLIIGIDPKYQRRQDVIVQTILARDDFNAESDFSDELSAFCKQVCVTVRNRMWWSI